MSYNYPVTEGITEMLELPDGTYLEIDCRELNEVLVTHWIDDGTICYPAQTMQIQLSTEA